MSVLQYTIEDAYADNYEVKQYIDGEIVSEKIIACYYLHEYCEQLESKGFREAYDLDEAKEKLDEAKEQYEIAKQSALVKANKR